MCTLMSPRGGVPERVSAQEENLGTHSTAQNGPKFWGHSSVPLEKGGLTRFLGPACWVFTRGPVLRAMPNPYPPGSHAGPFLGLAPTHAPLADRLYPVSGSQLGTWAPVLRGYNSALHIRAGPV